MPDFPSSSYWHTGGLIHTGSMACPISDYVKLSFGTFTAGGVWPAANRALYTPFIVETTVTAYQMAFEVTVQSGNYDAGIYQENGARVVSKASTAVPAVGLAAVDIADTTLSPGMYYMALNIDNVTAAVARIPITAPLVTVYGLKQQAVGAVTLPNPATFADPASPYLPGLAVVFRSTL